MLDGDLLDIAKIANIKIVTDGNILQIKHQFSIANKSIFGVLFFLFGGVLLLVESILKNADITSKILGISIGLLFLVLSILTIIKQFNDEIKITGNIIKFRYNLKTTKIPLNTRMKIKMKTEIFKVRGSDFIVINHFLQNLTNLKQEIPVLKFQIENKYSNNAIKLGNEITRIIEDKIRNLN